MININLVLEFSKDLTVLYVEDDDAVRGDTVDILDEFFKQVDTAVDGQLGLAKYQEYYNKNGTYYDLILTDINMPNKNGIEMSRDILNINDEQKIVVISAHNESNYLHDLINLGVAGFLLKPVGMSNLLQTLFSTTQAISDRKAVRAYYDEIAQLNDNLEKKLRLLKTNHKKTSYLAEKKTAPLEVKSKQVEKKPNNSQSDEDKKELLDAVRYELPELNDICVELDVTIIDLVTHEEYQQISKISDLFSRFTTSLSAFHTFTPLRDAILNLIDALNGDMPDDKRTLKNGSLLLESLIYSLSMWVEELVKADPDNINFYDASIITDIHSIVNIWTEHEDDDDNEMELF